MSDRHAPNPDGLPLVRPEPQKLERSHFVMAEAEYEWYGTMESGQYVEQLVP